LSKNYKIISFIVSALPDIITFCPTLPYIRNAYMSDFEPRNLEESKAWGMGKTEKIK